MGTLKINGTSKTPENINEKSKVSKSDDKRTHIIAQEIKLAKILAGNNKTLRDRALKHLKRWFEFRSQTTPFTEDDFMRVWKGLFYAMWMSDKPLFQEECAEMIASLVHLTSVNYSLMFFKCGLETLGNEWFGIDQLRLDKFLMFVRRLLRQGFVILKNVSWNLKTIKEFNNVLSATILNTENSPPIGLSMHFTEIYLEELAKVSEGNLKPNLMTEFVSPFIKQLALLKDNRQITCVLKNIFRYLIRQSDIGMEHEEKFRAWRDAGFPGGSINSMQKQDLSDDEKMSDDDDEDLDQKQLGENALDPRAGHVDVILPQLKFLSKQIVEVLTQNRFLEGSNSKSRKAISTVIDEFTQVGKGQYPLEIKRINIPRDDGYSTKTKNAVNRLFKFENKLLNKKNKRKNQNKEKSEEPVVKLKKKNVEVDNEKLDEQLKQFIKKSEGNIKINAKEKKNKKTLNNEKKIKSESEGNKLDEIGKDLKLKHKKRELRSLADVLYNNMTMKLRKKVTKNKIKVDDNVDNDNKLNLQKKILKPTGKKGCRRKSVLDEPSHEKLECIFERHSGTWYVYEDEFIDSSIVSRNYSLLESSDYLTNSTSTSPDTLDMPNLQVNWEITPKSLQNENTNDPRLSPISPQKNTNINNTLPPRSSRASLFKPNEWDVPLKEGETEIFVEFKKCVNKTAKDDFIGNAKGTKTKLIKRRSLDSQLIKNPFAKIGSTPGSSKKVKIALNLNQSQNIQQHVAQIKSSPGIPFDANKKPLKPLLKKRHTMSAVATWNPDLSLL